MQIKIFLAFVLIASFIACRHKEPAEIQTDNKTTTYTCPMHPDVIRNKPGTCPVCGMELVKSGSDSSSNDLMLTDSQIRLANIVTQKAVRKPIGQTFVINGRLTVDEQRSEVISSRAPGRIEKLFHKETGQSIVKGEALYTLYSESLLTLQQEYLLAKEQYLALGDSEKRYKAFLDAATKKLILYGLTKSQVDQLTPETVRDTKITFLAPSSGLITEISVTEGQYVAEGDQLYRTEDIGRLWVEAELYPGETSLVKTGDKIRVSVVENESILIESTVTFMSPEYRANGQITIMRAAIENPGARFKPGQSVTVQLTHAAKEAIALPSDAVIRSEKGAHVYVLAGHNTFTPRIVTIGAENFDQVEIITGLTETDTVAISGAYLLYSEIVLKKGIDPMSGHHH